MTQEMVVYTRQKNNKIYRSELKFCAKFMYSLLVNARMHNRTVLYIESKPLVHKEELEGLTFVLDHNVRRPRRFRIVINSKLSKRRQLLALGHELVHVKQFAKGELGGTYQFNNITFTKWKKRYVDESKCHYFDLDWEVEAHGKEYGLYQRYMSFIKKHRIKFKKDS